jgi:hypothetical protein
MKRKMRTKQKQKIIMNEVGLMLAQIKKIILNQKEAVLLDMVGCISLFIIFATALHIPILI